MGEIREVKQEGYEAGNEDRGSSKRKKTKTKTQELVWGRRSYLILCHAAGMNSVH